MRNCATSAAPSRQGCLGSQTPHKDSIDSFPAAMIVANITAGNIGTKRAAVRVRKPPHPMCARSAVLMVMVVTAVRGAGESDMDYERPAAGCTLDLVEDGSGASPDCPANASPIACKCASA